MDSKTLTVFFALPIMAGVMTSKYEYEILAVTSLGSNVTLECNNTSQQSRSAPANYTPVAWMLPDLSVLSSPGVLGSKFEILNDNWTLRISDVVTGDFGYYHCMMQDAKKSSTYLIRIGLNVAGPFFTNTWDQYRSNIFQGMAAFFGFIVASVLVIATHKYRWREPESMERVCKLFSVDSLDGSTVGSGSGSAKRDTCAEVTAEYSDGRTSGNCKVQLESYPQSVQSDSNKDSEGESSGRKNDGFVSENQF